MANIYVMHVRSRYFELLKAGTKTVEFRLNDAKRKKIIVGDRIKYICQNKPEGMLILSVSTIVKSSLFSSLIDKVTLSSLGGITPQEQINELEEIYDKVSEKKYGVLALGLERES